VEEGLNFKKIYANIKNEAHKRDLLRKHKEQLSNKGGADQDQIMVDSSRAVTHQSSIDTNE
jgi:hypothetical protein